MLQSIRDKAQGWFAWAIVILISVPFALWGIQEYLGVGAEPVMASVNDRDIKEREFENTYQRFRASLRQQLGDAYRADLFEESRLRDDVLQSMVRDELISQAADRMGLRISDVQVRSAIAGISAFQTNGQFDTAAYERVLRQQNYSTQEFQEQIRQALLIEQVTAALTSSELITQSELNEIKRLQDQKREISYLLLSSKDFVASGEANSEEIEAYYAANQNQFMLPERVRIDYLELQMSQLSEQVAPTEEELRQLFEDRQAEYVTQEQRRASHILIAIDEEGEEAESAARNKALEALKRLQNGEEFATLAKELSQDPGSAELGGDLGFVEPGMMDISFDKALFELAKGEISEPVRTDFGFHLIKITEVRAGSKKSFEDVKDALQAAYASTEAEGRFYKYSERLVDLAFEHPDSLEPVAEALGFGVVTSDWVSRTDANTIHGGNRAINAAFSEDVLIEGNNSELIEITPDHVMVLRVHDHEQAVVRPLDEVRDEIASILKQQKAGTLAEEKGKSLLPRLRQGEGMEQLAKELSVKTEEVRVVARGDNKLSTVILRHLFSMPRPESDATVFDGVSMPNGDFAVIALHKVEDGSLDGVGEKAVQALKASQLKAKGRDNFEFAVQLLKESAKVVINKPQEQQ
ncbi:SurA N-terminal domain-containing protein [Pseudomonadota bacterium]